MGGKALLLAAGLLVALTTQNSMAQCTTINAVTSASFKITGGQACSTSASLNWTFTKRNGAMTIEWGPSTTYGTNKSLYPSSPVNLPNLNPNTTYYYHVSGLYNNRTYEYTKSTFKTAGAVAPANKSPVITSAPAVACTTGKTSTYTITATDADNDPVTFTVSGQPSWITFASPNLTLKPVAVSINASVKVIAADGKGGADTLNLAVTVVPSTSVAQKAPVAATRRTLTFGTSQIPFPASADPFIEVSLFTLNGSRIMHSKVTTERGAIRLPAEGVTSGIYLMRLQSTAFSTMQTVNFRE